MYKVINLCFHKKLMFPTKYEVRRNLNWEYTKDSVTPNLGLLTHRDQNPGSVLSCYVTSRKLLNLSVFRFLICQLEMIITFTSVGVL